MEHILVIDDERSMLEFLELLLRKEGYQVTLLEDGRKVDNWGDYDLVISDLRMPDVDGLELLKKLREVDPDVPFIFITAFASAPTAIEALKLGAFDYITKPFQVNDFKNLVREALQARRWKKRTGPPQREDQQRFQFVGISPPMLEIYKLVGTVSTTDSTVLISGESGTGKELVAMAIHRASPRANTPFVSVNCGALPETLLESELFGYTRGAFTGALKDKKGLFEEAHGGTLFLDEIADMSPPMQVKLLRALQNKQIRRVGGTDEILIDTRVIAATNRDVEKEVETGGFREDLYYRLAVIPIRIPPLRERKTDIIPLVRHFIQKHNPQLGRKIQGISNEALEYMEAYDWPGNVRELENTVERAMTLEMSDLIRQERLPEKLRGATSNNRAPVPAFNLRDGLDLEAYLKKVERQIVQHALALVEGNQTRAAGVLGLSYRSLRHRMETLGIRKKVSSER